MAHSLHYPLLQDLGLNETEAQIYELLLEEGPAGGAVLSKKSEIGRGNVYNVLTSLVAKGLVTEEKDRTTLYQATDPERLRLFAKQKRAAAEAMVEQLESILPHLKSSYRLFTKQPTVRVFEGVDGIKEIYRETLLEKKTIYAFVSPDEPAPEIFSWLTKSYVKQRVEANISVEVIVNGSSQAGAYIQKNIAELRKARFVQNELYPFRGEIDVFGDKVGFIAYKKDELFGVIIESPGIAETLRSTVKLLIATLPA